MPGSHAGRAGEQQQRSRQCGSDQTSKRELIAHTVLCAPPVDHEGPRRGLRHDRGKKVAPATKLADTELPASHFFPRDEYYMRLALREAGRAPEHEDIPVGAVIVREGEVIGAGHNERELREDPTAHAELIALREAARAVGSWRVLDSVLYVTLEPCAMCAGAVVLARVPRVVFGTSDPKAGAAGSVLNVLAEPRLNHRPQVQSGLLAEDCADLLRAFFASRR